MVVQQHAGRKRGVDKRTRLIGMGRDDMDSQYYEGKEKEEDEREQGGRERINHGNRNLTCRTRGIQRQIVKGGKGGNVGRNVGKGEAKVGGKRGGDAKERTPPDLRVLLAPLCP
jgi:hypothetical protein